MWCGEVSVVEPCGELVVDVDDAGDGSDPVDQLRDLKLALEPAADRDHALGDVEAQPCGLDMQGPRCVLLDLVAYRVVVS